MSKLPFKEALCQNFDKKPRFFKADGIDFICSALGHINAPFLRTVEKTFKDHKGLIDEKFKNQFIEFTVAALNEKWERDYGQT